MGEKVTGGETDRRPQATVVWSNRRLWMLAWPLAVELLLSVFIGMADTVMVTTVGEEAVSAISLVDAINFLFITLFQAFATGGAVVVSQYLGRRQPQNASLAARQLLYAMGGVSLLLMLVSLVLRRGILLLIYGGIEPEVMAGAEVYFLLSALSYPFLAMYSAGSAVFRSMGNSRVSMFVSVAMNITNIGGNALLIFGAGWGVAGAGTASLLSRVVAAVVLIFLLARMRGGILDMRGLAKIRLDFGIIKSILKVGIPNGLENSMFQIGKLMVARIISTFGTAAIAANAIANNFLSFGNVPGQAIGLALLTVIGQTVGAGDYAAARRYNKKLMIASHAAKTFMALVLVLFMNPVLSLFNLSAEATDIARQCGYVYCISAPFFWSFSFSLPNSLRAAGDARYTMVVSIISMWVARVGLSYLLAYTFSLGVVGVWIAMVIDWVVRDIFFLWRWQSNRWQTKKLLAD